MDDLELIKGLNAIEACAELLIRLFERFTPEGPERNEAAGLVVNAVLLAIGPRSVPQVHIPGLDRTEWGQG